MNLAVPCDCGGSVNVTEGDAGSWLTCPCGRTVVVPSFRELRRQAGAPVKELPPELVLESLLLAGKLPDEQECVLCSEVTSGCITYFVEFERARVVDGNAPWWARAAAILVFGWLGLLLSRMSRGPTVEIGKDRALRLPLRICEQCCSRLIDAGAIKRALRSVPLYRKLLDRYPRAMISPCSTWN
ncbi:MAG TPA: hypothetical protein VGG61_03080 [Gemmataceae bacterium]|jgi:hypothetical protein